MPLKKGLARASVPSKLYSILAAGRPVLAAVDEGTEVARTVVAAGAGVAVPFAWVARLHGAKVVYVESLARIDGPSLSYRLIAPIAYRHYSQWPELASTMRGSRYVGNVFSENA